MKLVSSHSNPEVLRVMIVRLEKKLLNIIGE